MKTHNFVGIVLRKRPFMESDAIVSVLTEDGCRREFIAKGVQNGRSKRNQHLQLLNRIEGHYYEGKRHDYLQQVQSQKSFQSMKDELERILTMQMISEILEKTLQMDDPHPELYALLNATLEEMNGSNPHPFLGEHTLIQIAHHLGFLPCFKQCGSCHQAILNDDAQWNGETQSLQCSNCAPNQHQHLPLKYRKAMEFFRSAPHQAASKIQLQANETLAIREMILKIITRHMDLPLKSLSCWV